VALGLITISQQLVAAACSRPKIVDVGLLRRPWIVCMCGKEGHVKRWGALFVHVLIVCELNRDRPFFNLLLFRRFRFSDFQIKRVLPYMQRQK
jgi:hypothetical protein